MGMQPRPMMNMMTAPPPGMPGMMGAPARIALKFEL
jgi:hypothetical protein